MATHSVSNGTDGLDGSLVYELDRSEVCLTFRFFLALSTFFSSVELWSRLLPVLKRFPRLPQHSNLSYASISSFSHSHSYLA